MSEDFIKGAESFRKMLLESINPFFWPHVEGVFAVFAKEHNFNPIELKIMELKKQSPFEE